MQLPDPEPPWAGPHVDLKFEKTCKCGTQRISMGVMEGCEGWTRIFELAPNQWCNRCNSPIQAREVKRFTKRRAKNHEVPSLWRRFRSLLFDKAKVRRRA